MVASPTSSSAGLGTALERLNLRAAFVTDDFFPVFRDPAFPVSERIDRKLRLEQVHFIAINVEEAWYAPSAEHHHRIQEYIHRYVDRAHKFHYTILVLIPQNIDKEVSQARVEEDCN